MTIIEEYHKFTPSTAIYNVAMLQSIVFEFEDRLPEGLASEILKFGQVYNPLYAFVGLMDEYYEFQNAITTDRDGVMGEAGDVFWYGSILVHNIDGLEFNLVSPDYTAEVVDDSFWAEMAGLVKKIFRDKGRISSSDYYAKVVELQVYLETLFASVIWTLESLGIDIEQVLQYNMTKLKGRQRRNMLSGDGDNR